MKRFVLLVSLSSLFACDDATAFFELTEIGDSYLHITMKAPSD